MKEFISIDKAVEVLNSGGVVALPTETVYGLAAKINDVSALKKIFETKARPFFDPLIVHVSNLEMISNLTLNPHPILIQLAEEFWPGPLTLVFDKNPNTVSDIITSGTDTVAIRWPDHSLTEQIISKLNTPIAAPSANPFKKTSPTEADHVRQYFPNLNIVDGGSCEIGLESTIVKLVPESNTLLILRPGQISRQNLIDFFKSKNLNIKVIESFNLEGPGSMKEHYQPSADLYLFKNKPISYDYPEFKNKIVKPIIFPENPFLFARVLYKTLIEESKNVDILLFEWTHDELDSNWSAIHNRLEKAAKVIL